MSMCNVVGVLEDNEDQLWSTFAAAVDLADTEHARLTLAKTCEPGKTFIWVSPFAFGGAYVPPPFDSPAEAGRLLAQAAERVPSWIPVTTLLLGPDTRKALRGFLCRYPCDVIVTGPKLLSHCRRLGRDLRRLDVEVITVKPATTTEPEKAMTPEMTVQPEESAPAPQLAGVLQ